MADPNACGEIAATRHTTWPGPPFKLPDDGFLLPLPVSDADTARRFLEGLGGDAIGAGRRMAEIGINAPLLRAAYKREIEGMMVELARRLEAGEPKESVARWVSAERNRIISRIRASSGLVTRGIYELRDWRQYGVGGRSWDNIQKRYQTRGLSGEAMHNHIIRGAQTSNTTVNTAAMRGASYLRHGGRVVLVVGVAISAARIWNASEQALPRVIGEEMGGFIGGGLGAGAGVGVCMIFGIASGGWGLLACGVVGGLGGGVAGSYVGGKVADGMYYTDDQTPVDQLGFVSLELPPGSLYRNPPEALCGR
ncbi:MAG: hypothetical protein KDH20_12145 [Rhodocyclaceae bacterium]|nr:hypothetical protein [Rhodocyclaceae bacterium]